MSKDITDELIIREETSGYSFEKSKSDMEEDIKTLERMLKIEKECLHYDVSQDEIRAIEHLIKAYKELEEENKTLNERNQYLVKYRAKLEKELYESNENYIPVSLVEEKIEEYEEKAKRRAGTYQYADSGDDLENKKKQVIELRTKAEGLQELLEKR